MGEEQEMCVISWTDILDKKVDEWQLGKIKIPGQLGRNLIEELGAGYHFIINPPYGETAPIVDGTPVISVKYEGEMDYKIIRRLQFACSQNAPILVEGNFTYEKRGDLIGNIEASTLEF